jgi:predicted nucleotidyltransferase
MKRTRGPDPQLVERLRAAWRDCPRVRLAVLFGSAAVGAMRRGSDLDIAILPGESSFDRAQEAEIAGRLALAGGLDVDLIRLDGAVSTLLRWQIATEGVPLVEAQPGEFARFRAGAAAEYIEFAPALAHHAEIFRRRLADQRRTP